MSSRCSGHHSGIQIKPLWYQMDDNDIISQMPQLSISIRMSYSGMEIVTFAWLCLCERAILCPSSRCYWSYCLGMNKHLWNYNVKKRILKMLVFHLCKLGHSTVDEINVINQWGSRILPASSKREDTLWVQIWSCFCHQITRTKGLGQPFWNCLFKVIWWRVLCVHKCT